MANYTTHTIIDYVIRNSCPPPYKYRCGHPTGHRKLLQLETPMSVSSRRFCDYRLSRHVPNLASLCHCTNCMELTTCSSLHYVSAVLSRLLVNI